MANGFIRRKVYKSATGDRVSYEATLPYYDANGKRRQRAKTCKTRREAQKQLQEWERDAEAGVLVERSDQTVAEFLRYWMENHVKPNRRPNTYNQYRIHIENHIIPAMGAGRLQDVTAVRVQQMVDRLRREGVGSATVRCCYDRVSQALKLAVRLGLIPRNPAEQVERPTSSKSERKTWELRELKRFLEVAQESRYGPIWLLIASTGMRRGEAMGLRWGDIDFERGVMHIRQAVVMVRGTPRIGPTKSKSGMRDIPLSVAILDALRAHRAVMDGKGLSSHADDLVFLSEAGKIINASNLDRHYHTLIKRAGVPFIPIHGLRHTFATLMIAGGEDVRTISDILGHSRTSITTDIYGHVTPHRKIELMNNASDLILKGQTNDDNNEQAVDTDPGRVSGESDPGPGGDPDRSDRPDE